MSASSGEWVILASRANWSMSSFCAARAYSACPVFEKLFVVFMHRRVALQAWILKMEKQPRAFRPRESGWCAYDAGPDFPRRRGRRCEGNSSLALAFPMPSAAEFEVIVESITGMGKSSRLPCLKKKFWMDTVESSLARA